MYKVLFIYLFISFSLNAEDIGCASSVLESKDECLQDTMLQVKSALENLENESLNIGTKSSSGGRVKITKELDAVKVIYQKKEFLIERITNTEDETCPPNCVQSMTIGYVKTIGELETLEFISSLYDKKNRILIDARVVHEYMKSTIPSAVNIPHIMLSPKSKYRDEVLRLLGARKLQKKWYFRNIHTLLIFDNGILDSQATKIIESLIDIGYPEEKILYYRGGFNSWKELGLTLL